MEEPWKRKEAKEALKDTLEKDLASLEDAVQKGLISEEMYWAIRKDIDRKMQRVRSTETPMYAAPRKIPKCDPEVSMLMEGQTVTARIGRSGTDRTEWGPWKKATVSLTRDPRGEIADISVSIGGPEFDPRYSYEGNGTFSADAGDFSYFLQIKELMTEPEPDYEKQIEDMKRETKDILGPVKGITDEEDDFTGLDGVDYSAPSQKKSRKVDNPYEIWRSHDGTWEWRVLKKYQTPEQEAKNPYARWYCAVKSPYTYDSYEYGDTYIKEIKENATKVFDESDPRTQTPMKSPEVSKKKDPEYEDIVMKRFRELLAKGKSKSDDKKFGTPDDYEKGAYNIYAVTIGTRGWGTEGETAEMVDCFYVAVPKSQDDGENAWYDDWSGGNGAEELDLPKCPRCIQGFRYTEGDVLVRADETWTEEFEKITPEKMLKENPGFMWMFEETTKTPMLAPERTVGDVLFQERMHGTCPICGFECNELIIGAGQEGQSCCLCDMRRLGWPPEKVGEIACGTCKKRRTPMFAPTIGALCVGCGMEMVDTKLGIQCRNAQCKNYPRYQCPVCKRNWKMFDWQWVCADCGESEDWDYVHRESGHYMICNACARHMSPTYRKRKKGWSKEMVHKELEDAGVFKASTPMLAPKSDGPVVCMRCHKVLIDKDGQQKEAIHEDDGKIFCVGCWKKIEKGMPIEGERAEAWDIWEKAKQDYADGNMSKEEFEVYRKRFATYHFKADGDWDFGWGSENFKVLIAIGLIGGGAIWFFRGGLNNLLRKSE